jgi:hypothetical protein
VVTVGFLSLSTSRMLREPAKAQCVKREIDLRDGPIPASSRRQRGRRRIFAALDRFDQTRICAPRRAVAAIDGRALPGLERRAEFG